MGAASAGDLRSSDPSAEPLPGEVAPSKREQLIRLRAEETIGFRDVVVPLKEEEIKDTVFDRVEQQRKADLVRGAPLSASDCGGCSGGW